MKFDEGYTMHSKDYFRQLAEAPQTQLKKPDPTILTEAVQRYLAAGKAITVVPPGTSGTSGVILAPMGISKRAFKGAEK